MKEAIKCMIIDDEPLAIQLLKGYVEQTPGLMVVNTFENAISALEYFENRCS